MAKISHILTILLLFLEGATAAFAQGASGYWTDNGNYSENFSGGAGTETDPYVNEGTNLYTDFAEGIYIINGRKIFVRR